MRRTSLNDYLHILILHAFHLQEDKYDMGELRFSDIDRNILVASTEQTLLKKDRFVTYASVFDHVEHQHVKPHYSTKEHASDVFGAAGVYGDNLVTNEVHKLIISS